MNQKPRTFPRAHRLSGKETFAAVYDARVRCTRDALTIYARPNGLAHSRMGISISRRVGSAPKRNRIKRLLRESYRLMQDALPVGYDWIVVVRGHATRGLGDYRELMMEMTRQLAKKWDARGAL